MLLMLMPKYVPRKAFERFKRNGSIILPSNGLFHLRVKLIDVENFRRDFKF